MGYRVLMMVSVWILAASVLAQRDRKSMVIPIYVSKDNLIHLRVNANHGPNLDFIFDTGADTCVLTELGRAKMSQLRFDGHQLTLGSGGSADQHTASNLDLSIGGRTWTKQTLVLIDYHGALKADGVIGYNLFSQYAINLDFDRATMTLWNTQPASVAHLSAVEVTVKDGLAFIPVELNSGSKPITAKFAVDTGFGGTATVAESTAQSAYLPGNLDRIGSGKMAGTGGGTIQITKVRLPILSIGGSRMDNVPIDVQLSKSESFKTWNIVGSELLRRMNFTWDVPARKMYFTKDRHFADTFDTPPSSSERLRWLVEALALLAASAVWILRYRSRRQVDPTSRS